MAKTLPVLELVCGVGLLIGVGVPFLGAVAGTLLVVLAGAMSVNLVRGRDIDCGCHAVASAQKISWLLVTEDLALAFCAVSIALRPVWSLAWRSPWPMAGQSVGTAQGIAAVSLIAVAGSAWMLTTATANARQAANQIVRALGEG